MADVLFAMKKKRPSGSDKLCLERFDLTNYIRITLLPFLFLAYSKTPIFHSGSWMFSNSIVQYITLVSCTMFPLFSLSRSSDPLILMGPPMPTNFTAFHIWFFMMSFANFAEKRKEALPISLDPSDSQWCRLFMILFALRHWKKLPLNVSS